MLGAPVNNGFRMDRTTDIAAGATLQMISNNPVRLGVTNLNGGTLAVVPEPSAAMLLLGALTGLLARRARR